MIYQLEAIQTPEPAVTLEQAKAHLRVDHALDDAHITALIEAAQGQVEDLYLWQAITPRVYRLTTDGVTGELLLPMGPVLTVAEVRAVDVAGGETQLAESAYRLTWFAPGRLALDGWPVGTVRLVIQYSAGMAEAPTWAKQAILLLVGHWYEHREAVDVRPGAGALEIPFGVQALLLGRRAW